MKTKDFYKKFDQGEEDIIDDLDLSTLCRPNQEIKCINVDFPCWVVDSDKKEAIRIRISHQLKMLNANDARANLNNLIDEASLSHQPIVIKGKKSKAVLLCEQDWKAINETLYLVSIPGMRKSIIDEMATDADECSKDLDW